MEFYFFIIVALVVLNIIIVLVFRPKANNDLGSLNTKVDGLQSNLKEDFRMNREESANASRDGRTELNNTLKEFKTEMAAALQVITDCNNRALEQVNRTLEEKISLLITRVEENNKSNRETIITSLKDFSLEQRMKFDELKQEQKENVKSFNEVQREKFEQMGTRQSELIQSTEKKLEQMRETVDEKLQKTLNERLGQSFELVGKQLESVQKGLGEMQSLAQDVGGLKRVLSNVKMRGGIGEVQLSMLLEQILAPEQYEANVKTKHSSTDHVEFAIKLPGREDGNSVVYLPIDAKFPKDVYEQLQTAYDLADPVQIELAQKKLEECLKKMARDIRDKYIDPPNTTDFGILFLPFEGIYAEVVRKASLLEYLQRECKIIVTGPTTLAAILNSLQIGFKTLAIQKRSSEVWKVLGAVKKEFELFGGLLDKAQKNIQSASNTIDEVMGKRTRAIQRSLRGVEALTEEDKVVILPELSNSDMLELEDTE